MPATTSELERVWALVLAEGLREAMSGSAQPTRRCATSAIMPSTPPRNAVDFPTKHDVLRGPLARALAVTGRSPRTNVEPYEKSLAPLEPR